jgi:hypothetical protein
MQGHEKPQVLVLGALSDDDATELLGQLGEAISKTVHLGCDVAWESPAECAPGRVLGA